MEKQVRDYVLEGGICGKSFVHDATFSNLPYRGNIIYSFPKDQTLERDRDESSNHAYRVKCIIEVKGDKPERHRVSFHKFLDDYESI